VGDDPVRISVRADMITNVAGSRQFDGGGSGKVDRLGADLIRLRPAGAKWAHGQ
jgi:hypothetical protein